MSKQPFFSVVIPLFNKENYIKSTLKSVLNQTLQDFEIIIINDGSTDASYSVIKDIVDERIRIYSNENKGLSYSRNYGIKKAEGEYIALLDADDLWTVDYLECINTLISNHINENIFATRNYVWFNKKSPDLNKQLDNNYNSQLIDDYFRLGKNIFSYSSVVFHKSVFDKIGYFNEQVNHGEEEEFSIKCFLNYNLVYSNQSKVFYLKNVENQLTAPNKNRKRILADYESYLVNCHDKNLKKYIDFVHFKLVVLFKMERNHRLVKFYKEKINTSNLSLIQKIKYHLPTPIFYFTKTAYVWLSRRFAHFSIILVSENFSKPLLVFSFILL
jgi:glycosyltransferase involved in cell wall biosynthesis